MKKFEFQLEKILDIRHFQEEQAEFELGKALHAEQALRNQLEQLALQHAAVVRQIDSTTDFYKLNAAQQYFHFLDLQKEQVCKDLAQAQLVTEQKRTVLQQALQKYTAVSKLREKQYEQYTQQAAREEEAVTDDVVTSHFRNNK